MNSRENFLVLPAPRQEDFCLRPSFRKLKAQGQREPSFRRGSFFWLKATDWNRLTSPRSVTSDRRERRQTQGSEYAGSDRDGR